MPIANLIRKTNLMLRPDYFVCSYRRESGGESGSFAALGSTREAARRDAERYIQGLSGRHGRFLYSLRRPGPLARLRLLFMR